VPACICSQPEKNGVYRIDVDALLLLANWLQQRSSSLGSEARDNGGLACTDQKFPPAPSSVEPESAVAQDGSAEGTLATSRSRQARANPRSTDDRASAPASSEQGGGK